MKEITGNIWDLEADYRVVTTNGILNIRGELIMGAGIALEAKKKYPQLPKLLGDMVARCNNRPYIIDSCKIISFPTKYHYREFSDLKLIQNSARILSTMINRRFPFNKPKILLPPPGCGNGGLNWKSVKPLIEPYFDDNYIVVHKI